MPRLLPVLLFLASALPARAQDPGPLRFDVEVDPIAYALSGYSLHVGAGWERFRVDLGAFAMDLPEALHGNAGFDAGFQGFGTKLHLFPFEPGAGPFVGVGASVSHSLVRLGELAERRAHAGAGVEVGWLVRLPAGFHLKPWVSLDYTFGRGDAVVLGGRRFDAQAWSVFPTVHVGYRMR